MERVHEHEYHVRDLGTRSVTLFSSRAQIIRDIKDVPLKAGLNQITIIGLTPTVDEHSIKVEGTGSAIISDISVKLLPNTDIFQEIYPDSDSDESESDVSDDEQDKLKDSKEILSLLQKLSALLDDEARAQEIVASADSRLKILDKFANEGMIYRDKEVDIEAGLQTYRAEREKVFNDHTAGTDRIREIKSSIDALREEERRLRKIQDKAAAKAAKLKAKGLRAKQKEDQKKRRREEKRLKEMARIREEREKFWPKSCYSVCVTLDAASHTPFSSRRSSVASTGELVKVSLEKEGPSPSGDADAAAAAPCDLSLCYVTSSAFWSPSYDIALSTTANSALLCFDAQLTNTTSETWSNCGITLSTSQTSFGGLNEVIPTLVPWRVKLAQKGRPVSEDDLISSHDERNHKNYWKNQRDALTQQKPRTQLFGYDNRWEQNLVLQSKGLGYTLDGVEVKRKKKSADVTGTTGWGVPGSTAFYGNLTSETYPPPAPLVSTTQSAQQAPGLFGSSAPRARAAGRFLREASDESEEEALEDGEATMLPEPQPDLAFQESTFEETGMTTTYDLPGLKTLAPSWTSSKQRVARLSFAKVAFSHILVAKYRPAAFLKAKLRNDSKITLLKGPAGLTLDGSFMGRTTLPRCSAGDNFTLNLGIDPAVQVSYPKPDVRRSTSGIFNKEESSVYTRSIIIANTRTTAGKPIYLTVLDQVPVSQDEKLRIEIAIPRGLVLNGSAVAAGVPTKQSEVGSAAYATSTKDDKSWGRSSAVLKKGGEVCWEVTLNAGRGVKLGLEYEVALPGGERAVQC